MYRIIIALTVLSCLTLRAQDKIFPRDYHDVTAMNLEKIGCVAFGTQCEFMWGPALIRWIAIDGDSVLVQLIHDRDADSGYAFVVSGDYECHCPEGTRFFVKKTFWDSLPTKTEYEIARQKAERLRKKQEAEEWDRKFKRTQELVRKLLKVQKP